MKISDIQPGDRIVSEGFDCLPEGMPVEVKADSAGALYVECFDAPGFAQHYLDWHADATGRLIGFRAKPSLIERIYAALATACFAVLLFHALRTFDHYWF